MFIFRVQKTLHHTVGVKLGLLLMAAMLLTGCPVHQKPGTGTQFTIEEPQTNKTYYLYLPAGYDSNKRYPLVVTIHGIKPLDSADRQIREWQSSADKHGLIVAAPIVSNANIWWIPFVTAGVKRDEQMIMDIMDHIFSNTSADPDRVMITAWSGGGYMMHYVANQHPDRFAALCSRGSLFYPAVLDEENARLMGQRDFPLMVFYGQGDPVQVQVESKCAIRWYASRGFSVESYVIPQSFWMLKMALSGLGGHDRQPEMAAEFFQRVTGSAGRLRIVAGAESAAAPLAVNLSVQLPQHLLSEDLKYRWTLDSKPLAQTAEVHTSISKLGLHNLQATVTDRNGRTVTASKQITVEPSGE